jgi:hypothetical protein
MIMKRQIFFSFILLLLAAGCKTQPIKETEYGAFLYAHKAMPMDTANSLHSASWNCSITYTIKNIKI